MNGNKKMMDQTRTYSSSARPGNVNANTRQRSTSPIMCALAWTIGCLWMAALNPITAVSQKLEGSLLVSDRVQPGYTLFSTINASKTYLIDNCGNVINRWEGQYKSGNESYLMKNGNLVRALNIDNPVISRGGGGGAIEIRDWDSNLLWYFEYNTALVRLHHDITPLDNGNILMLAWELHTREEAIAAGRNPDLIADGVVWGEEIIEVKPIFPNDFEIVWRWKLWDHVVQDHDATKSNYAEVNAHPELVNLNFGSLGADRDWIHANSIDYNPALDQIMISAPTFNELWIIDHGTTTAQAASHTGGKAGKGGDLLYRWGNPIAYKKGTAQDKVLGFQHHAHWVKEGLFDAGKIMVFNNNAGTDYSAVEVIAPPMDANGAYVLQEGRFGPAMPTRTIKSKRPQDLRSTAMGSAEVQPNGNLLICSSLQGRLIELTSELDTAWLYKSPITPNNGIAGKDFTPTNSDFTSDPSFRAIKYLQSYPGLVGKDLTAGAPIENVEETGPVECDIVMGLPQVEEAVVSIYPNPVAHFVSVESTDPHAVLDVRLLDLHGRQLARENGHGSVRISTAFLPDGFFIAMVNNKATRIMKKGSAE